MKKRENIISKYSESLRLENIKAFGLDEEWQYNLARNFFLYTKSNKY